MYSLYYFDTHTFRLTPFKMGDRSSKFEFKMPKDFSLVFDNTESSGFVNFFDIPKAMRYSIIFLLLTSGGCLTHANEYIRPPSQKPIPTLQSQKPVPTLQNNTPSVTPGKIDLPKLEKPIIPAKGDKSTPPPPPPPPPPPEPYEDKPIPCDELELDEHGACVEV